MANWKVVKSYPDALGNIRVVDVKTASGVLRRPISKLCIIVNACDKDSKREVFLVEDNDQTTEEDKRDDTCEDNPNK